MGFKSSLVLWRFQPVLADQKKWLYCDKTSQYDLFDEKWWFVMINVKKWEVMCDGGCNLFLSDKQMILLSGLKLKSKSNPNGDIKIIFTGLRPGEKLYEELLIEPNSIKRARVINKANSDFLVLLYFI